MMLLALLEFLQGVYHLTDGRAPYLDTSDLRAFAICDSTDVLTPLLHRYVGKNKT